MNETIDKKYQELLQDIIDNGVTKESRAGATRSVFGRQIRHNMKEGFPLLTTKKMYFKGVVTELLWFLNGGTNIKYLIDNNCHIWDGDALKNFNKHEEEELKRWLSVNPDILVDFQLTTMEDFINKIQTDDEFAKKWGELGPIYGKQWRNWAQYSVPEVTFKTGSYTAFRSEIDQIANIINTLKTNPDDRRMILTAWNPAEVDKAVLPPCHYGFQVWTRELTIDERKDIANSIQNYIHYGLFISPITIEHWDNIGIPTRAISLMWNQRSVDTPLGLPFNIASYGLLLEIIGKMVNMVPDELIGNLGDTHIYLNQMEDIQIQLDRESYPLPTISHLKSTEFYNELSNDLSLLSHLDPNDFKLENYQSHSKINIKLSN